MTIMIPKIRATLWIGAAALVACVDPANSEFMDEFDAPDAEVRLVTQELKNGIGTSVKPAIGIWDNPTGWCSGTLISPRHVLSAAHCNLHRDTLTGTHTFTAGGVTRNVSRILIIGAEANPGAGIPPGNSDLNPDVALLELASAIPAANAIPLNVSAGRPTPGREVSWFGFGPNQAGCNGPGRVKRYFTFNFGDFTQEMCPGDSGGPATYGKHTENGAIWGVASFSPSTGDVWGDVSRFKEDILSIIRMWNHNSSAGIYGVESGFRRDGITLATHNLTSASSCRDLCNGNSSCNSFRHRTSTNTCFLHRDAGDWVPDPGFTSGLSTTNRFEVNVDRPGFNYANYVATLNTCSLDCTKDERCAAFSWVSSTSRCWLKEYLGLTVATTGVTSGTKRTFEHYTDRPGSDFSSFTLTVPDVRVCQAACADNTSCVAYTYRKQLFDSAGITPIEPARCWLKNAVPSPVTSVTDSVFKPLISGRWRATP